MHAHNALSLLVFALGAFIIPLFSGRIGIPAAVGEILFGVLVGPQLLGLVQPDSYTTFLAEFGFAFLMFLVGLELDFSRIEREGIRAVLWAMAVTAVLYGSATVFVVAFSLPPFVIVGIGAVSLGIVMVTLAEARQTKTHAGQTTILVGSFAEFFTIVLLTGFGMYYSFGMGWHLAKEMGKLALIFVAAYGLLVVLRTLIWWWPQSFSRIAAARDPSEVGVRAGMATMLVFVALATLMGVESILGSFIAGALFAFVFREKRVLEAKMASIGFGFFVPIFFIAVGADFDLKAVFRLDIVPVLVLLLVGSTACKILAALPLALRGLTLRQTLGTGLLLGTPLTLLVVIARLGTELKVLEQTTAGAFVLLAIVTGIGFPWAYRLLVPPQTPPAADSSAA